MCAYNNMCPCSLWCSPSGLRHNRYALVQGQFSHVNKSSEKKTKRITKRPAQLLALKFEVQSSFRNQTFFSLFFFCAWHKILLQRGPETDTAGHVGCPSGCVLWVVRGRESPGAGAVAVGLERLPRFPAFFCVVFLCAVSGRVLARNRCTGGCQPPARPSFRLPLQLTARTGSGQPQ
jgi:hypothetical protein